jgi:hypothetical protein
MNWKSKRMIRELQQMGGVQEDDKLILNHYTFFKFPSNYPFKVPSLFIHSQDHISYLSKLYIQHKSFIQQHNIPIDCICCFSVSCSWCPSNTCKEMYQEYVSYIKNLKNVIALKYFINHGPFDELVNSIIISYMDFF